MKLSAIVSALLIMLNLSLTSLYISAEEADYSSESVVIYRYAESAGYGRTDNRKDQISIPFSRFAETSTRAVEETAETALLIQKGIVDFIDYLAASSEESTETRYDLSAEKLAPLTYRIRHRGIGFEGVFAFNMPSDILMREIAGLYENVYWQETVETEYAGNYTITVIEAEDAVEPYGLTDFKDAMVSATLIADKHQPLWGIHDGAGLLDGLGYLLVERQNRTVQGAGNYRPVSSNQHVMEEIVLRIRQSGENLAQEIHTEVNSLVQYEEDGTFLLPEELLEKQEGDNLEFALTYYDLAVRAGCETKLLALRDDLKKPSADDYSDCRFITLFRQEQFGLWGFIQYSGYKAPFAEDWEDVPAMIARDNIFYYELDPAYIMFKRRLILPPLPDWSISIY